MEEKIVYGPWIEQHTKKTTSSGQKGVHYEALALPIVEARQVLQRVGGPFISSGDVLPVHCKNALSALGELKENVSEVSRSLHYTDSFAAILSPSRYPLLSILYTIEEQALQLIHQLDTYRFACLEPSKRSRQQQWEIVSQLKDISQQLADIPELVKSLDEDVESGDSFLAEPDITANQPPANGKAWDSSPKKRGTTSNKIVPIRRPGKVTTTRLAKNAKP